MIYNESGDNMKLNKKGFTLVELLTVMVILVTILLIAIPSITSSLSRSEDKQIDAKKKGMIADININLKREIFTNLEGVDANKSKEIYTRFKNAECSLTPEQLVKSTITTEEMAKNKKGDYISGCVKYNKTDKKYEFKIETECEPRCS